MYCPYTAQAAVMLALLRNTIGFAGAVLVRRVVGIAHVADIETITDNAAKVCAHR